jgi:hypothetical protein
MKGLLKTLEAVIAIIIIFGAFLFLFGTESLPEVETPHWKIRAMHAIAALDKAGQLRDLALAGDNATINSKIDKFLPSFLENAVIICGTECVLPEVDAKQIVAVRYLLSGKANNITNRQVIVLVWSHE